MYNGRFFHNVNEDYLHYKGREGGDLDVVEPHHGLTASPQDSFDGDLIPLGFNSLRNMVHMGQGGNGIFCCRGREVGRIGLPTKSSPMGYCE